MLFLGFKEENTAAKKKPSAETTTTSETAITDTPSVTIDLTSPSVSESTSALRILSCTGVIPLNDASLDGKLDYLYKYAHTNNTVTT